MALLATFDTPASLRDAPVGSPFYTAWSNFIAGSLAAVRPGDNGAFYDPTETDVNITARKTLTWIGFPRDVLLPGNRDNKPAAFAFADSDVAFRDPQNEYFEWYVTRNAGGKILATMRKPSAGMVIPWGKVNPKPSIFQVLVGKAGSKSGRSEPVRLRSSTNSSKPKPGW